jgi:hypothetical protein
VQDPDLFNRIMSRAAGSGSPGGTDGEDAAGEDEDD